LLCCCESSHLTTQDMEAEIGDEEAIAEVRSNVPRKVKKRRRVHAEDGVDAGFEEVYLTNSRLRRQSILIFFFPFVFFFYVSTLITSFLMNKTVNHILNYWPWLNNGRNKKLNKRTNNKTDKNSNICAAAVGCVYFCTTSGSRFVLNCCKNGGKSIMFVGLEAMYSSANVANTLQYNS